jgi:hypothetical protein
VTWRIEIFSSRDWSTLLNMDVQAQLDELCAQAFTNDRTRFARASLHEA